MPKIKNWSRLSKDDVQYKDLFLDSRFDRVNDPVVWSFENGGQELFYVVYKRPDDDYYISEYVGMDAEPENLEETFATLTDYGKFSRKNKARSKAVDILEEHPFPFGNLDRKGMKDEAKQVFERIYEVVYDDSAPRIRLTSLQSRSRRYASIRSRGRGSRVKLGVDWSEWESNSWSWRMTILLHEFSHIDHSNHKTEFWHDFANNFNDCYRKRDAFYDHSFDWMEIAERMVKDVHKGNLDLRVSTVGEMRGNMEDWLDVDVAVDDDYARGKWESKWDDVAGVKASSYGQFSPLYYPSEMFGDGADSVNWQFEEPSDKELWKFFKDVRYKDDTISPNTGHFVIGTARVEELGEEFDRDEKSSYSFTPCTKDDEYRLRIADKLDARIEVRGCS